LTNPVVGSPVLTRSGRIAVVETPESSTTSSVLSLLDIVTGDATVRTATPFWSRFPPASADINGDGAPEYAVVSGDPACATCVPRGVLLFDAQGSLLWSASMDHPPTTPPAMVDMDGDTTPDVMTGYQTYVYSGLACFRGSNGVPLTSVAFGGDATSLPLYVVDVNGDCLPDIQYGRDVRRGASCAGPGRLASKLSPQFEGEVVWRWEGSSDVAPEQVWDVSQQLSTNKRTGFFYLIGDVRNSLDQVVAHDESTFSVQFGSVLLNLEPFPQACREGTMLQATGTVRNTGSAPLDLALVFRLSGGEIARQPLPLAVGETKQYSQALTAPGPGSHTLEIRVVRQSTIYQSAIQQFRVETGGQGDGVRASEGRAGGVRVERRGGQPHAAPP
jgi:hypothetical protein